MTEGRSITDGDRLRAAIEARGVTDPRLLSSIQRIPREAFANRALAEFANEDAPLPIGAGQTISQPYVVALMIQGVEVKDDIRGGGAIDEPNAGSFVDVRKHGPTGRAKGRDTGKGLKKEAKRYEDWLDSGRDVFIYFNNDEKAYAAKNACELKEALGHAC